MINSELGLQFTTTNHCDCEAFIHPNCLKYHILRLRRCIKIKCDCVFKGTSEWTQKRWLVMPGQEVGVREV